MQLSVDIRIPLDILNLKGDSKEETRLTLKSAAQTQYNHIKTLFPLRLTIKIVLIIIAGIVMASMILYVTAKTPLGFSYGEIITFVSTYKFEILKKSLYIYAIFTVLMLIGITVLSIIYSHRVAGPLYRVKKVANELAHGNFHVRIAFRKNDLLHDLAKSINQMAQSYETRNAQLIKNIEELQNEVNNLEAAIQANDKERIKNAISALESISNDIEKILSEIKL
jgi:methyl-accepting chemotaxis protein